MIFNFGRCIYEPENWKFEAYYSNDDQLEESYAEEKAKENDLQGAELEDFIHYKSCGEYAILNLFFRNHKIKIRFYDNDIETFKAKISQSLKLRLSYVDLSDFNFFDNKEDYDQDVKIYGSVTTYN